MKAIAFATELASVVLTLFIVWFSLPPCVPIIVDFSRKFTFPDRLGYVCTSFTVFDFQRHGNVKVRHALHLSLPLADAHLDVHMRSLMRRRKYPTRGRCRTAERWKCLPCLSKQCTQNGFPIDLTGSLYLSPIADISARHTADDHAPRI